MTLRKKFYFVFFILFAVLSLAFAILSSRTISSTFANLEKEMTFEDLQRIEKTIAQESDHIKAVTGDYSMWDDTYNFISGKTPDKSYLENNFASTTFSNLKVDAAIFLKKDLTVFWSGIAEEEEEITNKVLQDKFVKHFRSLFDDIDAEGLGGVFLFEKIPVLVGIRGIVKSDGSGDIRGYMAFIVHLGEHRLKAIRDRLGLNLHLHDVDSSKIKPKGKEYFVDINEDDNSIIGAVNQLGMAGNPIFVYEINKDSRVIAAGKKYFYKSFIMSVAILVFGLLAIAFLLEHNILKRLGLLKETMDSIEKTKDIGVRIKINNARDEIGIVENSINKMLDSIDASQKEQAKLQQQVVHSAQLSSIGTLGSSIAHELNNPLTVIVGYAGRILRKFKKGEDVSKEFIEDNLNVIIEQGGRMDKIINSVRTLGRDSSHDPAETLSPNEIIEQAVILLQHKMRKRSVQFEFTPDITLPNFTVHRVNIESAIQNLINNAIDAFDNVGDRENKVIKVVVERSIDQKNIVFKVEDNASGIPKDILAKIFEPFYTTKPAGKGTGIGLSLTKKMIEDHRGMIAVESEIGIGTTFIVSIPIS